MDGQPGDIPEIIGSMSKSVTPSIRNPVVSLQFRVHQQAMIQPLLGAGMRHDVRQGLSILSLVSKPREYIWNNEFGKHDRQAVKYYDDRGASFTFAQSESDFIEYQALHHETMSRAGERPRPREFFSRMQSNLGEKFKVGLITFEGKLIAGFAMICDPRTSTVYLGLNIGYTRVRNIHSSMLYLNWKIVNWASENDFRVINFGITESDHNDPNHKMKEKFGSEFVPVYRFILPTSRITYSVGKTIDRKIGSLRKSLSPSEKNQLRPSDKK
ncbi:MAG: GNAT family N-acetyltransferase [Thaumarchaeota archaeon]|nr:GNAT family N-acetyltransferase [Nitrososphaerota archaeon]